MNRLVILISTIMLLACGSSSWASLYSGVVGFSGATDVGGAIITGSKWSSVAGLSWSVDQVGNNWDYKYTFLQPGSSKDIKTFDLQVGSAFTMADVKQATVSVTSGSGVNVVAPASVSNTITEDLLYDSKPAGVTLTLTNGLQWLFNGSAEYAFTLDLLTTRAPMWGDFMIHGESTNQWDSSIRNSDFNHIDALPALVANATYTGFGVLVPAAPVPVPPSVFLLGGGLSGMFFIRRRKS